jgi:23S rRNA (cytidine1920-2'-O)/16S rRNA (cytidine1409-2'-O)-methyltransferase
MGRRPKEQKKPLTEYLAEHYFDTVYNAEQAVKLGIVHVNGKLVKRPGIDFDEASDEIKVVGGGAIYVSRGGYKLQEAIKAFGIDVKDRVCLDIGSSTGGFSDCMLQFGAGKVYAIDTGYGQLDWKVRTNPKVEVVERMNVRYLLPERLYGVVDSPDKATFAAIDVSFISAIKVIPSVQSLLAGPDKSEMAILIKPQFEAGKNQVGRSGLVRNPSIHFEILHDFILNAYRNGLEIKKLTHSPLLGATGNLEFLAHAKWPKAGVTVNPQLKDWLSKITQVAYLEHKLEV